uniref:GTP-binding protein n=1 Tax=Ascaris suum TaxID=6253 RepID=F1L7Z2_ASCSU
MVHLMLQCEQMRLLTALRRFAHNAAQSPQTSERCLQVAVIGPPNSGKSLLTNQIVRAQVSAVSSKMDTTQRNVTAALTEHGCQLVVVDSPGTIGIQHARKVVKRNEPMLLTGPERALEGASHVLVVHDSTATGDYIHHRVLHLLHRYPHLTSSLVLNKIDLVQRRSDLLELVRILCNGKVGGEAIKVMKSQMGRLGKARTSAQRHSTMGLHTDEEKERSAQWQQKYRALIQKPTHKCGWLETKSLFADIRGWSNFDAVFFVSSLTGEGIDALREHLYELSEDKAYRFDENMVTTKKPMAICEDAIRAQLLDNLPSDIAYALKIKVTEWQMEGDVLQIVAEVQCDKEKWGRYVLGKGNSKIMKIGKAVNVSMQNLFKQQLFVRILVKSRGKLIDNTK